MDKLIVDLDDLVRDFSEKNLNIPIKVFRFALNHPTTVKSRHGTKEINNELGDYDYFPDAKSGEVWLKRMR